MTWHGISRAPAPSEKAPPDKQTRTPLSRCGSRGGHCGFLCLRIDPFRKHDCGATAGGLAQAMGGIERYEPTPDYRAARSVYPYSVVPGGVLSEAELETAMAKDPVVAQHYRDILAARLHLTRLNTSVNVYASYRSANSVYWTSHTIRVPKGELVLSDGTNLIRARCGNRLVFTPPPGSPRTREPPTIEPPELVFDYALPPIFAPPEMPEPPHVDSPPPQVAHFWPPAVPAPTWCCGPGGFPGNGHQPRPPGPSAISEPTTMLLLGSGAFVMLIRIVRRPGR